MKIVAKTAVALAVMSLAAFSLGALFVIYKPYPWYELRAVGKLIVRELTAAESESAAKSLKSEPIRFPAGEISKKRHDLSSLIFGSENKVAMSPPRIVRDQSIERAASNSSRTVEQVVAMEHGINSRVVRFSPKNNRLGIMLYHSGHAPPSKQDFRNINKLLGLGYEVVLIMMPLVPPNNRPIIDIPSLGIITLNSHSLLPYLPVKDGLSLKYLLLPIISVLNSIEAEGLRQEIGAIGYSGGGWSILLAAAIDERLSYSVSVAGSLPLSMRGEYDWGDYEQHDPALYNKFNYSELYLLASTGKGRRHRAIHHEFDRCCFQTSEVPNFVGRVQDVARGSGGDYSYFVLRNSGDHKITDDVLENILIWL